MPDAESPRAAAGATSPPATRVLDHCLACGGGPLRPRPMAYEYRGVRFPLVECRVCGMRALGVQPVGESLAEMYASEYFASDFRCGHSDTDSFTEASFRDENRGLLDAFATIGASGRLLEVGCAAGWLLKAARERGWQVQGVELSGDAVAHARGLGLAVHHGDLISARLPAASADLVYLGDVLEHVPDCRAVLLEITRVLRPGGWLYLRGPITTHSLARTLALALFGAAGRTIVLREPPYHLWEFTPRPFARLLGATGFEVVSMRQSKIAPGQRYGRKSAAESAIMNALDAVNVPLTRAFNSRGDRVVVVARTASGPALPRSGA